MCKLNNNSKGKIVKDTDQLILFVFMIGLPVSLQVAKVIKFQQEIANNNRNFLKLFYIELKR